MRSDKNVFITLIVVLLFGIVWFAMFPEITAWASGQRVVECEPGYTITNLENGGIRVEGVCRGVEPVNDDDQDKIYDYPYPVPDQPYPVIDNPCDRDWAYGEECEP